MNTLSETCLTIERSFIFRFQAMSALNELKGEKASVRDSPFLKDLFF